MKYCMVLTTFENKNQAKPLIEQLFAKKLAACVQFEQIESFYEWQGKVQNDPEVRALIKTKAPLYEEVKDMILRLHPYDTPQVVQVDIAKGSAQYLGWIDEVVKA